MTITGKANAQAAKLSKTNNLRPTFKCFIQPTLSSCIYSLFRLKY